jgi:7,8-dihydropterin-6-yl-methyl-4-(beta-D-ribofuranosyl)aminobenzene 5'-phosphate synthase
MPRDSKAALDALSTEHLHWIQYPKMLSDAVGITGYIPRKTEFEDAGGPFYLDPEGKRPDLIEDDLALWFRRIRALWLSRLCVMPGW